MYYFQFHNKIDIINNSMSARDVKNTASNYKCEI